MTGATTTSHAMARERELLSLRRQRAGLRLSRERAHNSRLALAGFVILSVGLGVVIHNGWAPVGLVAHLSLVDADAKQFAETHKGHIRFTSVNSALCRELQFNNDTGRFSDGSLVSCGTDEVGSASPDAMAAGPNARVLSIRDAFKKR
jgi:hypothetical protein